MNLDLLKKLTRLANSNPNEHEANSAARRVCKMLEEANWSLTVANTNPSPRPGTWEGFRPSKAQEDFYNARTWNDVRRSPEPEFKSKPPNNPNPDFSQKYYDEMKNMTEEMYRRMQEEVKSRQQNYRNQYYGGWDVNNEPLNNARNRRGYDPQAKKLLKCARCGKDKMTGFIGNPAVFICQDCAWS